VKALLQIVALISLIATAPVLAYQLSLDHPLTIVLR